MRKQRAPYKLNVEELCKYIDNHKDAYQTETSEHLNVTPACISIALKRAGNYSKKSHRSIQIHVN